MAKQKGIIPLVGTIGGINFYYLNGKPVARMAGGGFNGKAIKTKASMQRVRENGSEFGHCSQVNKAFRAALLEFHKGYKFTYFHSRLMRLFTGLKVLDSLNKRGERLVAEGVSTTQGLALLKHFEYTPDCKVPALLPFDHGIDSATFALTFTGFDIKKVGFVTGATHIELTYGVLDFDFEHLNHELYLATPLVLNKSYSGHTVILAPNVGTPAIGTRLCVLAIRFYQEVDGKLYLLNAKNSVGIVVLEVEA